MSYLESELDSNSLSIVDSIFSKSDSESDFNAAFMNLGIGIPFGLYLHSS